MTGKDRMVLLDLSAEADIDRLNKLLEGAGVVFGRDIFGLPYAMAWPLRIRMAMPAPRGKGKGNDGRKPGHGS